MLFVKDNCPIQLNSYLESLSYESTTKQIKFDLPLMTVFDKYFLDRLLE